MLGEILGNTVLREILGEHCAERERERLGNTVLTEILREHCADGDISNCKVRHSRWFVNNLLTVYKFIF